MMQDREPEMGKNFWLAMVLSMLVIFAYPTFIQWLNPNQAADPTNQEIPSQEFVEENFQEATAEIVDAVEEVAGPAFEKPTAPTTYQFSNKNYDIEFSTLGATVSKLYYHGDSLETTYYDGDPIQPGSFGMALAHERVNLNHQIFTLVTKDENEGYFEFAYTSPGDFKLTKKYFIDRDEPVIRIGVSIENLSRKEQHFPLEFTYKFFSEETNAMDAHYSEAAFFTDKVKSANQGKVRKKGYDVEEHVLWGGLVKKYFALLVKPDWKALSARATSDETVFTSTMRMEPLSIYPGQALDRQFLVYAGTQRYEVLKSLDVGFENILSRGFFGMFKSWLLQGLKFLNRFTHNYGFAIILLTLFIKLIFYPLTNISIRSMKKMQVIQPKIKALQEKHKKNPEKLNQEMMQLFKRNKVNPMAGCLPMLVQMPILFAMFRILPEAIELKDAPFIFWMKDLSQPDALFMLPFTIPFLGWTSFNLLPILMMFSQMLYQKTMPQATTSPEQAKIMNFMPIFFGFICYNMSSGLVLYWFVQNLLSIVQQYFTNRISVDLHHEDR